MKYQIEKITLNWAAAWQSC